MFHNTHKNLSTGTFISSASVKVNINITFNCKHYKMLKTILHQQRYAAKCFRSLSIAQLKEEPDKIKAWQVHSFGEDLQYCSARTPVITKPSEILVKVEASSVNPIDILMKDGYGRTFIKMFRCQDLVLPITLGRDFSGIVIDKGHGVGDEYQIGDKVYGVVPFYKQGSHAENVVVDKAHIVQQPCAVTHTEAAAVPYAALTAYSALWFTGGLRWKRTKGIKVLILGASGGVGTCAVQMLRAVGATVIGTCSTDAVPLVQGLGADCVLDYRDTDYIRNVASQGRYDIILDCAKMGHQAIPSSWQYTTYISLNSPLLRNTDQYGLIGGLALSAADLIPSNLLTLPQGKCVKWAYFYPSTDGLQFIDRLIRNAELVPMIDQVYSFNDMPEAFERTKAGHLRGKIVIDMLATT